MGEVGDENVDVNLRCVRGVEMMKTKEIVAQQLNDTTLLNIS